MIGAKEEIEERIWIGGRLGKKSVLEPTEEVIPIRSSD